MLRGAARLLGTGLHDTTELGSTQMDASLDARKRLSELRLLPAQHGTEHLLDHVVGRGFRAAAHALLGEEPPLTTSVLLDDLPVAALISGYASLYSGKIQIEPKHLDIGLLRPDICAGWSSDATMLSTLRERGGLPVPIGPPAEALDTPEDELAWHDIGELPRGAMRRRRLLDVASKGTDILEVSAMFRDTHHDHEGVEAVLHEYSFTAEMNRKTHVLSQCSARPHVLPWVECPAAAASASRLDGLSVEMVNQTVQQDMRGTSTCTHLNDLLRSLSRAGALGDELGRLDA